MSLLSEIRDNLLCPICRDIFNDPVSVTCDVGHVYCFRCISLWHTINKTCPLCRQKASVVDRPNFFLDKAIEAFVGAEHIEREKNNHIRSHEKRRMVDPEERRKRSKGEVPIEFYVPETACAACFMNLMSGNFSVEENRPILPVCDTASCFYRRSKEEVPVAPKDDLFSVYRNTRSAAKREKPPRVDKRIKKTL